MAGVRRRYKFHGAFSSKAKAVRKEAARARAFIKRVIIKGHHRFLVMTSK